MADFNQPVEKDVSVEPKVVSDTSEISGLELEEFSDSSLVFEPADDQSKEKNNDGNEEEEEDGLWLNLPIDNNSDNNYEVRPDLKPEVYVEQYEKLLTYSSKYSAPSSDGIENQRLQRQTSHNDYQFSEKDYRRHRKGSHHHHETLRPLTTQPDSDSRHHRKHRKKKEKSDRKERKDKEKHAKSPPKIQTLQVLPQIAENEELAHDEIAKENENRNAANDVKDGGPDKKHHHHKHRRRHHHNKGISLQDSLESRIRTGLQTLEDEKKAIKGIMGEIDDAGEMKHLEEITSHRFENMKGVRRRAIVPRQRSGMTTHIRKASSSSKQSHMQITLPKFKHDHDPKEGFVELEELTLDENNQYQWRERARWIKFEEDVEKNDCWGKPHVASLSFHSLLELRKGIENGSVLLDIEQYDIESIFDVIAENMVTTDQIDRKQKEQVVEVLLSKHRHQHQQRQLQRRFSLTSLSSLASIDNNTKDSGVDSENDLTSQLTKEKPTKRKLSTTSTRSPSKSFSDSYIVDMMNTSTNDSDDKTNNVPVNHVEFQMGVDDTSDLEDEVYADEKQPLGVTFAPTTEQRGESKTVSDVSQRIPVGAEATSVLVGSIPGLTKPSMAFVRLAKGCLLGNLTEVSIPVRFMFILVGPAVNCDHYEIGRSIATLMSDKIFHDLAYAAKNRDDILDAINSFLDDSVVLAPGDWDRHLLLPLLEAEILKKKRQRIALLRDKATIEIPPDEDPFYRTGHAFGGLIRDIRRKLPYYKSDFYDGFNGRCLVTIIFILFATFAPTVMFGGLLSKKTDQWLGVKETIMATSLCGVLFGLCAGQPLIIVGTTGPILVFEQATYELCKHFDIEFLPWRFWIGLWVMIILCIVIALEGCYLVEFFTRFTEEVFTTLISLLFIYEAVNFLFKVFKENPLNYVDHSLHTASPIIYIPVVNVSMDISNMTFTTIQPQSTYSVNSNKSVNSSQIIGQPNTALMSTILLVGTFFIALYLRKLRHSHFFSSRARRVMSDFGVPIAMLVMVGLDAYVGDVYTKKISMPNPFRPTKLERTSFTVNPFGMNKALHVGWIAFALVPGLLVSILLFMETELTGVLVNKKQNKLKKGSGYNLDLFMMGLLTLISSAFGLPWMCAATVRSVQHVNALTILSRSHAPGERAHLIEVKEQRFTNVVIHALVGLGLFLSHFLNHVPFAVLFGVFLYLGVCCLSGVQLMEQIIIFFKPPKHRPNKKYIRLVNKRMILFYTFIQLTCLVILFIVKLTPMAPLFPFIIICMVFIRKQLERVFTQEELEELDKEEDDEFAEGLDEYQSIYMPV